MEISAPRSRREPRYVAATVALCLACAASGITRGAAPGDIAGGNDRARLVGADAQQLASFRLAVPVAGVDKAKLMDTFNERRGNHPHEALDIPAARGTQVVAAGDGRVVKLFRSGAGGLTVYQFDPSERFAYYYAHLDRYAEGLTEGKLLKRGDPIGAVGTTGNAREDSPHLHFAIFKLGPEKKWWQGLAINPLPLLN